MERPEAAFPGVFARPAPARVNVVDQQGERVMDAFFDFLRTCQQERDPMAESNEENMSQDGERRELEYVVQLKEMTEYGKSTLFVDFTRLLHANHNLAAVILESFFRFEPYLRRAVQKLVQVHQPNYLIEEGRPKEFYVAFYNMAIIHKLRDMKTESLGQLASVGGVVVRTSEVRPELLYGTFRCLECGHVQRDVEQQFKYTQPIICTNAACSNRDRWALERTECQFVDWQRVRLQENSDEVPAGSLPRTLDVILRHETVEQARPGDKCVFTGTLVVVPDVAALARSGERQESVRPSGERGNGGQGGGADGGRGGSAPEGMRGLRALGVRDLNYRMAFLASAVQSSDRDKQLVNIRAEEESDAAALEAFTAEEKEEITRMGIGGNIYERLVSSVAPSVFGHHDIKRAILLMLFGGVHKQTQEGINLRGDINVCIVGDPSCAKSQFLKYVASFLPRAVYTSGKSSSAAGLTATVAKEPETGEFCIEAGALMLADNGICCIDEFDKMDVKDQVAIHEAMEQQTISIAKAGIQATLNARTSILAAANPTGGRYDKSKPLKYNVALPPAILSRFDLVHVMVDTPDVTQDYNVAKHIVSVHQSRDAAIHPEFTTLQLQKYIKYARAIKPEIAPDARVALTEAYVSLRRGDAAPGSHTAYRITVRQLEALVRLSEALARVHLEDMVRPRHVREAKRLLSTSIISVESQDVDLDVEEEEEGEEDPLDGAMGGGVNGRGPRPDGGAGEGGADAPQGNGHAGEGMDVDGEGEPGAGAGAGEDGLPPSQQEEGEGEGSQARAQSQARAAGGGAPGAGQKTTIPLGKLEQVTTALVMRLRQYEDERAVEERERAADEGTEGAPGAEPEGVGMRQGDLVRWFVTQQNEAGSFESVQELVSEYRLVRRIIQHLISREGTLILLGDGSDDAEVEAQDTSALLPQELEAQRATAVDRRILAVNPNYVLE